MKCRQVWNPRLFALDRMHSDEERTRGVEVQKVKRWIARGRKVGGEPKPGHTERSVSQSSINRN